MKKKSLQNFDKLMKHRSGDKRLIELLKDPEARHEVDGFMAAPPCFNNALAMESEATLTNQECAKDWEYRIIAVNKPGEGIPSNTVAAVV